MLHRHQTTGSIEIQLFHFHRLAFTLTSTIAGRSMTVRQRVFVCAKRFMGISCVPRLFVS